MILWHELCNLLPPLPSIVPVVDDVPLLKHSDSKYKREKWLFAHVISGITSCTCDDRKTQQNNVQIIGKYCYFFLLFFKSANNHLFYVKIGALANFCVSCSIGPEWKANLSANFHFYPLFFFLWLHLRFVNPDTIMWPKQQEQQQTYP